MAFNGESKMYITWQRVSVSIALIVLALAGLLWNGIESRIANIETVTKNKAEVARVDKLERDIADKVSTDRYCIDLQRIETKIDKIGDYLMRKGK